MSPRPAMPEEMTRFIEDFGLLFEERGSTRMAGRIYAYLLVCDPPGQTASQIVEALGVSKGSVSSAMRFLTQLERVERYTEPGERSAFYRAKAANPRELFGYMMAGIVRVKTMAERGLSILPPRRPERRERLERLLDTYTLLEKELTALIARVEKAEKKPKRRRRRP